MEVCQASSVALKAWKPNPLLPHPKTQASVCGRTTAIARLSGRGTAGRGGSEDNLEVQFSIRGVSTLTSSEENYRDGARMRQTELSSCPKDFP